MSRIPESSWDCGKKKNSRLVFNHRRCTCEDEHAHQGVLPIRAQQPRSRRSFHTDVPPTIATPPTESMITPVSRRRTACPEAPRQGRDPTTRTGWINENVRSGVHEQRRNPVRPSITLDTPPQIAAGPPGTTIYLQRGAVIFNYANSHNLSPQNHTWEAALPFRTSQVNHQSSSRPRPSVVNQSLPVFNGANLNDQPSVPTNAGQRNLA